MELGFTIEVREDESLINSIPTSRFMTPEEFTMLVANRATMIANSEEGSFLEIDGCHDPLILAERELLEVPSKFPLIIIRHFRDGSCEYCCSEDMVVRNY